MHSPLRYEQAAAAIYTKLRATPRTGWVMSGVTNPETVYDHTVALVHLASHLAEFLELNEQELDELQLILEVHDWPEAIVGDEVILDESPDDYQAMKAAKREREAAAMHELCDDQVYGETALAAWQQYEAGNTKLATLAKELDKYQAVELDSRMRSRWGFLYLRNLINTVESTSIIQSY